MKYLHALKAELEALSVMHQQEVMRILMKHMCDMTENVNGTFVVLNHLKDDAIGDVKEYLEYVRFQSKYLEDIETRKEILIDKYFNKVPLSARAQSPP